MKYIFEESDVREGLTFKIESVLIISFIRNGSVYVFNLSTKISHGSFNSSSAFLRWVNGGKAVPVKIHVGEL